MPKIKYGLRNVYAAKLTETVDGTTGAVTYTYGTPRAWPGAVSMALDAQGSSEPFYADDEIYYVTTSNAGYSGAFECAYMPDWVRTELLGQTRNGDKVVIETSDDLPVPFALLYEMQTSDGPARFVEYDCILTRPSRGSATRTNSTTPRTDQTTITVMPRADRAINAYVLKSEAPAIFEAWYSSVYETPTTAEADPPLAGG